MIERKKEGYKVHQERRRKEKVFKRQKIKTYLDYWNGYCLDCRGNFRMFRRKKPGVKKCMNYYKRALKRNLNSSYEAYSKSSNSKRYSRGIDPY